MNDVNSTENKFEMSPEALATLESVVRLVWLPQADVPQMAPGQKLFALHAADGTPIMLTDSREAAIANAWSQELETLSVH